MKKRLFAAALCLLLAFGLALFASACDDTGNAGPAGGGTVNTGGAGEDEKETFKLIYGAGEGGFLSASADGEKLPYILREGVESGIFRIKHTDKMAMVMLLCLQGLDVPYIRDNFKEIGIEKDKLREYLYDFILYGIKQ